MKISTGIGEYIKGIATLLRARPAIGGLEISDVALRFVWFVQGTWKFTSVRVPPGLMELNQIKNRAEFVVAVRRLREQVLGAEEAKKRTRMNAVISLSSISIYSQVFGLPIIQGENLERAVQLNIQMVSPVEVKEAYSGWQLVGEDKDTFRLEVLSAFIDRKVVDNMMAALIEGGIMPVAIESRALALARLVRERAARIDSAKPYVLVNLDSSGIDLIVLRRGHLYFEYFHGWKDIQNERGQITREAFRALLEKSIYQVMNFYGTHWPEPMKDVLLSAAALREEVTDIITKGFGLAVQPLALAADPQLQMTPEWFVALGSALRGLIPRGEDRDISLLGIGAQERFRQEQVLDFVSFWRTMIPAALGVLLIAFIGADMFLINLRRSLESQAVFQIRKEETAEIESLRAQAVRFNKTLVLLQSAQSLITPREPLVKRLATSLAAHNARLSRLYFQDESVPMVLSGEAQAEADILDIKKEFDSSALFQGVQLPLTEIKKSPLGGFSFSMTLTPKPK